MLPVQRRGLPARAFPDAAGRDGSGRDAGGQRVAESSLTRPRPRRSHPGMRLLVQKYGGTSVATTTHIGRVADRIVAQKESGARMVIVVSAMGHATDDLIRLAHEIHSDPPARELDMLLTVGERVSMALLSMALQVRGHAAISFTGSQSGIITDQRHADARILEIRAGRIEQELTAGNIVIVAGFQGVSQAREITTLGRGGSDTTAVALAAALGAERCDICTDVDGVCSADPRIVERARVLPVLSYDEMVAFAAHGALVLHPRAAEVARRHRVPLRICSSFNDSPGTAVGMGPGDPKREGSMIGIEQPGIRGVTSETGYTWVRVRCDTAQALQLLQALAEAGVSLRFVAHDHTGFAGLVRGRDAGRAVPVLRAHVAEAARIEQADDVASLTVIGTGLDERPGVAATVLETLAAQHVDVRQTTSSALTLTCAIPAGDVERATRALHLRFGLDA
jgi:aspartate kinase